MANKPVLGKGLASLFPGAMTPPNPVGEMAGASQPVASGAVSAGAPSVSPEIIANKDRHPGISIALVEEIQTNPYQPRREFDDSHIEELAQSIQSNGIIQPLVVRRVGNGYQLIAGERRLRAAKKIGLKQVPIVIRKSTDRESLELALIENIQRQNLNCVDESLAYFQLQQEFSLTQDEIAVRVGKERATVANYLRLLKLPESVLQDLKESVLTFGHGKALLAANDPLICLEARNEVIDRRLSVRDTEVLVTSLNTRATTASSQVQSAGSKPATPTQQRLRTVSDELTRKFSVKVEVKGSDKKGKIVLHYKTREDLDRIIESLHT